MRWAKKKTSVFVIVCVRVLLIDKTFSIYIVKIFYRCVYIRRINTFKRLESTNPSAIIAIRLDKCKGKRSSAILAHKSGFTSLSYRWLEFWIPKRSMH